MRQRHSVSNQEFDYFLFVCFICINVALYPPTPVAMQYPYVLAFEASLIEVRNVETGSLEQIIEGHNLQCLFSDNKGNILVSSNDPTTGSSEVFSLKIVEERDKKVLYE